MEAFDGSLGPGSTRVTSSRVGQALHGGTRAPISQYHVRLVCPGPTAPSRQTYLPQDMSWAMDPWANLTHALHWGRTWRTGGAQGKEWDIGIMKRQGGAPLYGRPTSYPLNKIMWGVLPCTAAHAH